MQKKKIYKQLKFFLTIKSIVIIYYEFKLNKFTANGNKNPYNVKR